MSIYKALRAFLLADAPLAAVLGTRIYPIKLPQNPTFPAVTIQQISGFRYGHLRGPASLARPRYQIDAWTHARSSASAFEECQVLGGLLLSRLEAYSGMMADTSTSPVSVYQVWVEFIDDRELFEEDINGGFYRYSADYFIWWQTTTV